MTRAYEPELCSGWLSNRAFEYMLGGSKVSTEHSVPFALVGRRICFHILRTRSRMDSRVWAPLLLLGLGALSVDGSRVLSATEPGVLTLPGPPLGEDFKGLLLRYL